MEQNRFFRWISRINSILFLLLLLSSLVFVIYGIFESSNWRDRNKVEVVDKKSDKLKVDDLHLSDIESVCGTNIQYVKLESRNDSRGFSSGRYGSATRNIIFFEGQYLKSHWLFDSNGFVINQIDVLHTESNDCKSRKAVAIYYQIREKDTNGDGNLDEHDQSSIGLSSIAGLNYKEIDSGLTSVIDHRINSEGTELTVLVQQGSVLKMKRFSITDGQLISETEISRIRKKL